MDCAGSGIGTAEPKELLLSKTRTQEPWQGFAVNGHPKPVLHRIARGFKSIVKCILNGETHTVLTIFDVSSCRAYGGTDLQRRAVR